MARRDDQISAIGCEGDVADGANDGANGLEVLQRCIEYLKGTSSDNVHALSIRGSNDLARTRGPGGIEIRIQVAGVGKIAQKSGTCTACTG